MISRNLASRETHFLMLLERGVFNNRRSPYARLFAHAGIELRDVAAMVSADGIEATLGRLHDHGVWLALAEAKGRQPVRREGLEFTIGPHDLHNTLISRDFEGTTGGSRSSATRFWVDLGTSCRPVPTRPSPASGTASGMRKARSGSPRRPVLPAYGGPCGGPRRECTSGGGSPNPFRDGALASSSGPHSFDGTLPPAGVRGGRSRGRSTPPRRKPSASQRGCHRL